jgi:DNA polymerase-3 subunit delta'
MSRDEGGAEGGAVYPDARATTGFFGHREAERALLDAYRTGRIPHAWLLGGPAGIGKATLAFRMARFVLAHGDATSPAVRKAESLEVAPSHPVARQVANQAHPDLLVLERTENESGNLRTVITVDQVRRTISFFGSTAGAGGWRVCIVDTADELQYPQASNALLKMLEEPPRRALFLLVSNSPGRLLPTIRSRCCRVDLRPPGATEVAQAVAAAMDRNADEAAVRTAAAAADGSVARALNLLAGEGLVLRERVTRLLEALPATDARALHAVGEALAASDDESLTAFVDAVRDWLSARLRTAPAEPRFLAGLAEAWERVNQAAEDVEIYNLDPRPLVFSTFSLLAETARG